MSTPALPLEASLSERDLPELVQALQEQAWTGLLTLQRGLSTKSVTVERGRMVFAMSSDPDERMGVLLMRRGQVSLRQVVDAGAQVNAGKRLGAVLVERGVLEPKALVRAVVDHSREIILHAFSWGEGRYKLEPGQRPEEAITLNIDPAQLILEGIRRIESWKRIDRAIGGLEARYRARRGGGVAVQKLELGADDRAVVEQLGATRSVEQLCAASKLSSFEVCRLVWALRVIGYAERVVESAGPEADDEGLGAVLK